MTRSIVASAADFDHVTSAISHIIQSVALLVGGTWAFLKFVRGRTFAHRLDVTVQTEFTIVGGIDALLVQTTVKNDGLSVVEPDKDRGSLMLFMLPSSQVTRWREWLYMPNCTERIFDHVDLIEPGETVPTETLLFLPFAKSSGTAAAYRVTASLGSSTRIRKRSEGWSASCIAVVEPGVTDEQLVSTDMDNARGGRDAQVLDN
jgi:hypothetical protein